MHTMENGTTNCALQARRQEVSQTLYLRLYCLIMARTARRKEPRKLVGLRYYYPIIRYSLRQSQVKSARGLPNDSGARITCRWVLVQTHRRGPQTGTTRGSSLRVSTQTVFRVYLYCVDRPPRRILPHEPCVLMLTTQEATATMPEDGCLISDDRASDPIVAALSPGQPGCIDGTRPRCTRRIPATALSRGRRRWP